MILSAKERDSWRGNRDFVSFAVYISVYTLSLQSHLYLLLLVFLVLFFLLLLFFVVGFGFFFYKTNTKISLCIVF